MDQANKEGKERCGEKEAGEVGRHITSMFIDHLCIPSAQEQYFYIITSCIGLGGCSGLNSITQ